MREKSKHLRPIQKMMVLTLLVLLSILTTQISAIAQGLTRAQMAVILGQGHHGSNFTPPPATGIFDDVSVNDLGADWIEQIYKDGITKGCSQNPLMYCPDTAVDRAMMAAFLLRSKHGKNYTPPPATGIFDDVPIAHWAADWIEQLYREKITKGCSASPMLYCPYSPVTGVQTSLFIARTFGGPPAPVPKPSNWAEEHGVTWPVPRFTDNGDGTVTDHLTRLIWLKRADCFEHMTWHDALNTANTLAEGQCGLSDGSVPGDWRLPNVRELHSLINYASYSIGIPMIDGIFWMWMGDHEAVLDTYWTGTRTRRYCGVDQTYYMWTVEVTDLNDRPVIIDAVTVYCLIGQDPPSQSTHAVWPVRGGN